MKLDLIIADTLVLDPQTGTAAAHDVQVRGGLIHAVTAAGGPSRGRGRPSRPLAAAVRVRRQGCA